MSDCFFVPHYSSECKSIACWVNIGNPHNLRLAIHCDWVNTESMSGTLTRWEKTTSRIWMFQMTCRLSTSLFFLRYLGFQLSVRDPENAWQWEMMRSTLTALMKPSHETGFPVDGKDPCLDLYSTCSFPRFKEDQTTIQPVPLISSRFEQRYKPTHNTSNFQGSKCIKCSRVLIFKLPINSHILGQEFLQESLMYVLWKDLGLHRIPSKTKTKELM